MVNAEWWELVDENWDDLIDLILQFHLGSQVRNVVGYAVTAPGAEALCKEIREEVNSPNPSARAEQAKKDRNGNKLWTIFNDTWFGMPESVGVRSCPGFGVLCDLCSEYEGGDGA